MAWLALFAVLYGPWAPHALAEPIVHPTPIEVAAAVVADWPLGNDLVTVSGDHRHAVIRQGTLSSDGLHFQRFDDVVIIERSPTAATRIYEPDPQLVGWIKEFAIDDDPVEPKMTMYFLEPVGAHVHFSLPRLTRHDVAAVFGREYRRLLALTTAPG